MTFAYPGFNVVLGVLTFCTLIFVGANALTGGGPFEDRFQGLSAPECSADGFLDFLSCIPDFVVFIVKAIGAVILLVFDYLTFNVPGMWTGLRIFFIIVCDLTLVLFIIGIVIEMAEFFSKIAGLLLLVGLLALAPGAAAETSTWAVDGPSVGVELAIATSSPLEVPAGGDFYVTGTATRGGTVDTVELGGLQLQGCTLLQDDVTAFDDGVTFQSLLRIRSASCSWTRIAYGNTSLPATLGATALTGTTRGVVLGDLGTRSEGLASFWVPVLLSLGLLAVMFVRVFRVGPWWLLGIVVAMPAVLNAVFPDALPDTWPSLVLLLAFVTILILLLRGAGFLRYIGADDGAEAKKGD